MAAARWSAPVTAEGSFGRWAYAVAKKPGEVGRRVEEEADSRSSGGTSAGRRGSAMLAKASRS